MEKMPDGNSAALRQEESRQVRDEEIYEAYASKVEDAFVGSILSGEVVKVFGKPIAAQDFINGFAGDCCGVEDLIDAPDAAMLLVGNTDLCDQLRDKLVAKLEKYVRGWLKDSTTAQDWVMERCRDWNEDDRQRYREED